MIDIPYTPLNAAIAIAVILTLCFLVVDLYVRRPELLIILFAWTVPALWVAVGWWPL